MHFTIPAFENKILKKTTNGYDIIFSSNKYKQFCSYTKKLELSMNVPIENIQYQIIGGSTKIWDGILRHNVYPVENIPFHLLIYHELIFYFDIPDNLQKNFNDIVLNFDLQTDEMHKINAINSTDIEWPYPEKNYLRFISGMIGLLIKDNKDNEDDIDDIINVNGLKFIKFIPAEFNLSSDGAINKLVNSKHDGVYERYVYRFESNNTRYITDNFNMFIARCDGLSNFKIISDKKLLVSPIITFQMIALSDCIESVIGNKFIYSFKSFNDDTIINVLSHQQFDQQLKLTIVIDDGIYTIEYDRIYLHSSIRNKLPLSPTIIKLEV